jgi:lipoprotein signal peptidase
MIVTAERSYRKLLWTLVLVGITLDQATKYGVFRWLYNNGYGDEYVLVPGVFKFIAQVGPQVNTITVGGAPVSGQVYTVEVNGRAVTYTASGLESNSDVAKKLSACLDHSSISEFDKIIWTTDDGSPVIIATAKSPGSPFALTSSATGHGQLITSNEASLGTLVARLRSWSGPILPKVNEGALFGLGSNYKGLANLLFAIISVSAAVAIIYWSSRPTTARDPVLCVSLGLILAGTLGNLYDRLIFNGVRDFLYFHWFEFPVFNVADCCLVCGAFLLLAQALLHRPVAASENKPAMALTAAAGSAHR